MRVRPSMSGFEKDLGPGPAAQKAVPAIDKWHDTGQIGVMMQSSPNELPSLALRAAVGLAALGVTVYGVLKAVAGVLVLPVAAEAVGGLVLLALGLLLISRLARTRSCLWRAGEVGTAWLVAGLIALPEPEVARALGDALGWATAVMLWGWLLLLGPAVLREIRLDAEIAERAGPGGAFLKDEERAGTVAILLVLAVALAIDLWS